MATSMNSLASFDVVEYLEAAKKGDNTPGKENSKTIADIFGIK